MAPIIIEGEEQRNNSGILLRLSISIPRAELKEILKDATVPLLEFFRDTVSIYSSKSLFVDDFVIFSFLQSGGTLPKRPEINILLKQTTNMLGSTHGFSYESPKTELRYSKEIHFSFIRCVFAHFLTLNSILFLVS